MVKEYIALFEYEDGKEGFGVVFPDLPGCFSAGNDFNDAYKMAHEAVALYADGEEMPIPRTLEQIKAEWPDWAEWEKEYKFMVAKVALYPLKTEVRRFNVSLSSDLVSRIDRVTKNRSAFLASAAELMLSGSSATTTTP